MRSLGGRSERGYLNLPWGQVHFRRAGESGAPTVVLVHQSPLSSATFEGVLEPLAAQGLHVVAPDNPGFGMSDPTPTQWSIPEYASGLWQALDELGLDQVVLLGQHTGAVVACEAARQRPSSVRGVILQGLPLYSDAEREEKLAGYAPGYQPKADGSHLMDIWERVWRLYPEIGVAEADRQVQEYLATGPDYATAYRAVFRHQVDVEALRDIPVALVHGERDLVHRFTDEVVAAMPWAELELVPGTDFPMDEHPDEFVHAVAKYARKFHGSASAAATGETKAVYTAVVSVTGGRGGRAVSQSGAFVAALARPAERGTEAGTDPEELFAAGYAACFDSALQVVARRTKTRIGTTTTTAAVSLCVGPNDAYSIAAEIAVEAPECPPEDLERLVALAHETCPYSKATRGNIPVTVVARVAEPAH